MLELSLERLKSLDFLLGTLCLTFKFSHPLFDLLQLSIDIEELLRPRYLSKRLLLHLLMRDKQLCHLLDLVLSEGCPTFQ